MEELLPILVVAVLLGPLLWVFAVTGPILWMIGVRHGAAASLCQLSFMLLQVCC